MCTLTNDDIHKIRKEYSEKTKGMTFDEYTKDLKQEVAPLVERLFKLQTKS